MKKKLIVLLVEDNPSDEHIFSLLLKKEYDLQLTCVETENAFINELRSTSPDIILSDYSLPSFDGLSALKIKQKLSPQLPFIIVTGSNNEEIAVECMKAGADDYILKDNTNRLIPAIESAITKAKYLALQQETQNNLNISEDKYRYLFYNHPHPMWIYDVDTLKFIEVNDSAIDNYGYTREEFKNLTLKDIRPQEEISSLLQNIRTQDSVIQRNRSFRHKKKDGTIINVEISSHKLPSKNNENHRLVMAIDITEQYRAEKLLKESEGRLRSSLDGMLEGCQIIGFDWRYIYLNKTAEIHNRRPNDELIGNKYFDMWPGIEKTEVFNRIKDCLENRIPHNMENNFTYPDGLNRWFDLRIQPVPEGVFILSIDITERKLAEEELHETHSLLKIAAEKAKLGGWNVILEENRSYWSDEVAAIHEMPAGYHPLVEDGINFYAPEWRDKITEVFTDCAQKGIPYDEEMEILTASGKRKWVRTIGEPVRDESGKIFKVQGAFQDITERKNLEQEIIASRDQLENVLNSITDAFITLDHDYRITYINPEAARINKKQPEEFLGKTHWEEWPASIGTIVELQYRKVMNEHVSVHFEHHYFVHDMYDNWLDIYAYPTDDGIAILYRDISERKKAEQELNRHRKILQLFVEHAPAAIAMFDNQMRYLAYSKRFLIDYDLGEVDITGKSHYKVFPEIPDRWKDIHNRCLAGAIEKNEEDPFPRADGSIDWVRWEIHPWFERNNEIGGIILFSEVITERKQAEEKAKDFSAQLEAALSSMTDAVFISDAEGRFIHFNDAFATFHKFKDKKECATTLVEHHDFLDIYFPDGNLATFDQWAVPRALRGESAVNEEYILQRKDTGETWVGSYSFAPIRDNNNNIVGSVVTARDITELKKINDALRESKEIAEKSEKAKSLLLDRSNEAQSTAKIGNWDFNLITGEVWWSDELYKIFGVDPQHFVPSLEANAKFVHPDDNIPYHNELHRCIETGDILDYDVRIITPNGTMKYGNSKAKIYYDDQNKPIRLSGTFMDITDRKNAEKQLKQLMNRLIESEESFRKKASQQLHDEVGQNLTALTINLNYLLSQLDANTYNKAYNRLKDSLSILDNTVEQIRNIMVELRPSVLDDYGLFAALKWSAAKFKDRTNINVQVLGKELSERLPINIEYAIFRSVQEIFHNIAKHAQAANVFVNFEESKSKVILQISDDGIGFDASVVIKSSDNSSFGLQSISERMELIGAKINIDSYPGKGTSVLIEIER